MRELSIDIETYSSEDLTKVGVYRYVEAPDFEVMLFGYAFGDDPITVVDFTDPEDVDDATIERIGGWLRDPEIIKTAANANFERVCLAKEFDMEMDPSQWRCSIVKAATLGLPRKLGDIAKVLGFEEQKMASGKALISYFCKPCKPTQRNGGRLRNLPKHDPDKWALFKEYNAQDVVVEREIRRKLARFEILPEEQRLWELDQRINDRGVLTDGVLVGNAIEASEIMEERTLAEAVELTGLDNPNSVGQLKAWLEEATGLEVESLTKKTVPALIKGTDDETVKRVLQLRSELAKASVKKYMAIDRAVNQDSRLRGTMLFYGARTGRWAGRIFQPQNLPQNKLGDLALARELLRAGDYEAIELLFGDVPGTLSQLVRTSLIPRPGSSFIVADFSAIEARVIAWFAQEKWRLDVFATHGKIYEASAEQMFHLPTGSIDKHTPEGAALRQKGKVSELALGYGGGTGALIQMGALDQGLTEDELPGLVKAWRKASPKITQFWWDVGDAAIEAVASRQVQETHGLLFEARNGFLFIRLPSGRRLAYAKPRIEPGRGGKPQLVYDGTDQKRRAWGRLDTYGPRLVENIVQAASRDLLACGLLNIADAGYDLCFHVHDEVIVEAEGDPEEQLEKMVQLMTKKPAWAEGLPLTADGYACDFYRKE